MYLFSLLLAVGAFLGLAWVVLRAEDGQASALVEAGLWSLAGALIGGRIFYVVLAWPYFSEHPLEAFQIYLGGIAWSGAMLGGLAAAVIYALLSQRPLGALLDALVPLPAVLAITGWIGCYVDSCGYTPVISWIEPTQNDLSTSISRGQVYLIAALATLVVFWVIDRMTRSSTAHRGRSVRSGLRAGLLLLSLALIQLGAALFIVPNQTWRGFPVDAWAALAFAGLAVLALGIVFRSGERGHENGESL